MSDYIRVYNLTIKDSLPTGNSNKVIKGTELDVELNAAAAAISSKADSNNPTFTGTPAAPTASYGTNTTQLATTAFVQAAMQAMYPVGSVYINASSTTSPTTLLGFGTWSEIGAGKVLIGQDTGVALFDTLGNTGGSKDAIAVSHTHTNTFAVESDGAHTHTTNDPSHSHGGVTFITGQNAAAGGGNGGNACVSTSTTNTSAATTGISINSGGSHTHAITGSITSAGSSGTNANLPPYITVKMWKRTA